MNQEIIHIEALYNTGRSIPAIARDLGRSQWTIYKLLRQNGVQLRKPAESNRLNFLASPLGYSPPNTMSGAEEILQMAGLMLYWAEGSKRSVSCVDLANSDPDMIRLFLKFLRVIYSVQEQRLRVYLYCYSNQDSERLIEYWSKITSIPAIQFTKPYVRTDYDPSKIKRMPHGMIHVRYNDKRLLVQLKEDIQLLTKQLI